MSIRKLGGLTAAATLALTAGAVISAGAAQAYPTPAGAVSGSCASASESATIGNSAASTDCTFTLLDAKGNPAKDHAVTFSKSGPGTLSGADATTGSSGTAKVTVNPSACAAVGGTSITVTAAIDDATLKASGSATVTISCTKATTTVTATGCTATTSTFGGYNAYTCSWTSNAADSADVSYSVSPSKQGFAFGGDEQPSGGAFSTDVYIKAGFHGTVSVTGAVSSTATSDDGSAANSITQP